MKRDKHSESIFLRAKKDELKQLNKDKQAGTATADQISREAQLRKDIAQQRKEEYTLHQTLEQEAYDIGKSHDRCTAEFFRPWSETHAAQHIESLKEADWTDPSNPQFTGRVVRTSAQVLAELTKYYTALFAKKVTDPAASAACLALAP